MAVDGRTARDIDEYIARVLAGAGQVTPPVQIEAVLAHLRVDRTFYDLAEPGLLRRLEHKMRVGGHDLLTLVRRKVKLAAVWLPDDDRILVDQGLHDAKKRWASFHDAVHRVLPWHRDMFLGDTAQTLDPGYQDILEEEANFGASALMFAGPHFTREALDADVLWKSVNRLSKRYGASLATTLRRFVTHGHDRPLVAVISSPPWLPVLDGAATRHRHVVASPHFARSFRRVTAEVIGGLVEQHVAYRRGGIVGDETFALADDAGQGHEFRLESFYNQFDCLTLIAHQRALTTTHVAVCRVGTAA